MRSPDDPAVVALEVFEQLLRVNVPHEDVLPDPGHRHVLRLVEDAAVGARGSRDHVPELGGEEEPRQARHAAVRQRPDEEALHDGGDEVLANAVKRSIGSITGCTITEKAPTRAFSWLKAPTSTFTFKTLLRHYANQR